MTGVGPVLLGVTVHQGAHKVGVDARPGELVPLVPLALDGQVAVDPEGERSPGWKGAAQVGSEVG